MALQLTIEHPSGITCEYWKIYHMNFDLNENAVEIGLCGYVNEQTRLDGHSSLDERVFIVKDANYTTWFDTTTLDAVNVNHVSNAYLYIKSIPNGEFATATDV